MPKTEPIKSWPVRCLAQRTEPPTDKGRKFEPFHIAAIVKTNTEFVVSSRNEFQ